MSDERPFHETIVEALERANAMEDGRARREVITELGRLLTDTKIPKNHRNILAAWETLHVNWDNTFGEHVHTSVRMQMAAAAQSS